ncbi:50S ribosomal protein L15 [Candidatus Nomurabacteria bacterium]|nr:50S ribosomal protein L15 [Candidatus Nomurabacteria bacterium]
MQIHNLKRKTPLKKTAQVGRGGKRGKTSGRGTKGQKARSGRKIRPELRDLIKKIPKLRGYDFKSIQIKPIALNLDVLEKTFENGDTVSPKSLIEKGVLKTVKGNIPTVKILSNGDLTKKLNITDCTFSAGAKTKIEKAGGTIKI